jgi:FtsZ-binding cell division protein ZapB
MICGDNIILCWSRTLTVAFNARLASVIAALFMVGCATQPATVSHFIAPSTVPISQSQSKIAVQQVATETHIKKAEAIVKTLTLTLPEDKTKVDALTAELEAAQASNDELKTYNDNLQVQATDLTNELNKQTAACNTVAQNYDKQVVQNTALQASRHGWVKRFWIAAGLCLAAGIWIFKGPLLALTGVGI